MVYDRRICCCGASVWTKAFGFIQIVVVGTWIALVAKELSKIYQLDPKDPTRANALPFYWVLISALSMDFLSGIVLLVGTTKEQISLLWAWVVIQLLGWTVSFGSQLIEAKTAGVTPIIPNLVRVPITCFVMWVVWCRIQDLNAARVRIHQPDRAS